MASLENLTDGEIRTELARLGFPVGPITNTTRKTLLKKLKHLLEQSHSDVNDSVSHRSSSRFSSGDESEEDAKPETRRRSMPPPKKTPPVKSTKRRSSGRSSGISQQDSDTATNVSVISNASGNGFATSSPEKEKYSPPSFSDSYLRGKRNSLFGSLSGRRSYRPELDSSKNVFNSYNTGLDTDINEREQSTRSNFISQNNFGRGGEGFTRSLGLPSANSYVPGDTFKNRFLSSKTPLLESVLPSSLGNEGYDNSNSYSDVTRRFSRPGTSFSNRIGGSLTSSPSLRFSNVKESDDEEPVRNTAAPQFTSRSRTDRWTLDSPWWKNTSLVSMGLILLCIIFFGMILIFYMNAKSKVSQIATSDINFPNCRGSNAKVGVNCVVEDDFRDMIEVFRKMYKVLHEHVVRVKCEDSSKSSALTWTQLSQLIIENNSDMSIWEIERQYGNLQVLIKANPNFGIVLSNERLDIPEPSLGFSCVLMLGVKSGVWVIGKLIIVIFIFYILKRAFNWWMCRKEEHKKEVFKLVEAIIDLLQTHSQNCGDRDTFLAVDHVRDQLIPPHQRYSMTKLWDDAVSYLESKESRVRSEVQQVAGEDCHVWRWLPTNNRRKMWQGQAFETQEGSVNSLSVSPTPCLKIRHMFDPDEEVGDEWMTHVQDAILEKCEGIKVLHIAVDKGSLEGCVYLKCSSSEEAGKAFRALHGSWFDSKLVTVKYLRVQRYHERFPQAVNNTQPLRPSNNHKMSLQ